MPRSRLPNLLTNYAPKGIRNQGRSLKRLLDEWDQNRPAMAYFPESEMLMIFRLHNEATRGWILWKGWWDEQRGLRSASEYVCLVLTFFGNYQCFILAPKQFNDITRLQGGGFYERVDEISRAVYEAPPVIFLCFWLFGTISVLKICFEITVNILIFLQFGMGLYKANPPVIHWRFSYKSIAKILEANRSTSDTKNGQDL
jgi:hypothetical protein